jgi:hypothetical protein
MQETYTLAVAVAASLALASMTRIIPLRPGIKHLKPTTPTAVKSVPPPLGPFVRANCSKE